MWEEECYHCGGTGNEDDVREFVKDTMSQRSREEPEE